MGMFLECKAGLVASLIWKSPRPHHCLLDETPIWMLLLVLARPPTVFISVHFPTCAVGAQLSMPCLCCLFPQGTSFPCVHKASPALPSKYLSKLRLMPLSSRRLSPCPASYLDGHPFLHLHRRSSACTELMSHHPVFNDLEMCALWPHQAMCGLSHAGTESFICFQPNSCIMPSTS